MNEDEAARLRARNRALRATLAAGTEDADAFEQVLHESDTDPHGAGVVLLIEALAMSNAANTQALAPDGLDQLRFMIAAEDAGSPL